MSLKSQSKSFFLINYIQTHFELEETYIRTTTAPLTEISPDLQFRILRFFLFPMPFLAQTRTKKFYESLFYSPRGCIRVYVTMDVEFQSFFMHQLREILLILHSKNSCFPKLMIFKTTFFGFFLYIPLFCITKFKS